MLPLPRSSSRTTWARSCEEKSISRPSKTLRCSIGDGPVPTPSTARASAMCTALRSRSESGDGKPEACAPVSPTHSTVLEPAAAQTLREKPAHTPQIDIRRQRVGKPGGLEQRESSGSSRVAR